MLSTNMINVTPCTPWATWLPAKVNVKVDDQMELIGWAEHQENRVMGNMAPDPSKTRKKGYFSIFQRENKVDYERKGTLQ